MKPGKVSQTVYRRSIQKQLYIEPDTTLFPANQAEECWGIKRNQAEEIVACDVSLYGNEKDLCVFAMAQAVGHLEAKGARAKGVKIEIMLPDFAYESRLKTMMAIAGEAAKEQKLSILGAQAQIVPVIRSTIVHVTALGALSQSQLLERQDTLAEQDIVLLNWVGLEGMLRIKREKEAFLAGRFTSGFMDQIENLKKALFSRREIATAVAAGVSAIHQITDGGIWAALWNMAETARIGLTVDLKKIAIKQETIEVCEYFHLNPYQLTSAGSFLVITRQGEELADTLIQEGMQAAVIGHTQKGMERVILNGGEKRFLDRPAPDELTKIILVEERDNGNEIRNE